MTKSAFILNFFRLYNILWRFALPFLAKNRRLASGFERRISPGHHQRADIWIQAASAGEAYLAVQILKCLSPSRPMKVLVTTLTEQGKEILENRIREITCHGNLNICIDWFPFDRPDIIEGAVKKIQPTVMVLLETEIWPALLWHLKQSGTRTYIINARLSRKSFFLYQKTGFLWKHLAPETILATSRQDSDRYRIIFPDSDVRVMHNIKFESMETVSHEDENHVRISRLLPGNLPVSILASVRRQEEKQVISILNSILNRCPDQVVALFPRHMHRIKAWEALLKKADIPYKLRSGISSGVNAPAVILWDTFGELQSAYRFSHVVFIGGSLVPLGGQNFIEPAIAGALTVTGPHLDDFAWAGEAIFQGRLVTVKKDWKSVADFICGTLARDTESERQERIMAAADYLRSRKGGARAACNEILKAFD